jgi:hypothetical protein
VGQDCAFFVAYFLYGQYSTQEVKKNQVLGTIHYGHTVIFRAFRYHYFNENKMKYVVTELRILTRCAG